jgi:hypothetical protein
MQALFLGFGLIEGRHAGRGTSVGLAANRSTHTHLRIPSTGGLTCGLPGDLQVARARCGRGSKNAT